MPPLYAIAKLTVVPLLRLGWLPRVEGIGHIPATGGAILAGNHLSVADELFVGALAPRHIAFWAKSDYFTGSGARGWLSRTVLEGLGAIPVHRATGRASLAAFDGAFPVLAAGGLVVVYPEGTRSPDGRLYRGRTGVARLALRSGVPVVPVGVRNTARVQPIGARLPRPFTARPDIRFGAPLHFGGREETASERRAVTDEIMRAIQRLSGQEYVPRYAPRREPVG
ncbi:1-acyl-sn-glycerol-3-phosphate acyltransferase [Pilimelia terevasa]|uniref:1-acyl-sn-glycerol-3-phosphate acyltransferase n=1 Tax=Pilimelia terevasa TaxID=53372 RepID=A0A8J3FKK0_9ACTN|nr:lysophospholipid acyltransferase family protein [Pilimelia terevasa]GGK40892.1 1-acyl-sn-glycerol-3-phosphate acyltransferase [Pilimelia terevasa]